MFTNKKHKFFSNTSYKVSYSKKYVNIFARKADVSLHISSSTCTIIIYTRLKQVFCRLFVNVTHRIEIYLLTVKSIEVKNFSLGQWSSRYPHPKKKKKTATGKIQKEIRQKLKKKQKKNEKADDERKFSNTFVGDERRQGCQP